LSRAARAGDTLIAISSSGASENIIRSLKWANDNGLNTIAMTGFNGGQAAQSAQISLHVDTQNYGIVEDAHQSLMHILAQYIRQSKMDAEKIRHVRF
jgi:phosphoheptose isomerase